MVAKSTLSQYEIERNKPMPSLNHSILQINLGIALAVYKEKYTLASELKLKLPPDNWESVPDISILPKTKLNFKKDVTAYTDPPLATIEILSPTQSLTDLTSKTQAYFKYGVKSCWIVLPEFKNIYVFTSNDNYEIFKDTDTLLDKNLDISFSLNEIFQ